MDINELQNAALSAAVDHIKDQREANRTYRLKTYCLTVFACILVICATALAGFAIYSQQKTIIEQQYALNMQYAQLMEYVANAEITTETVTNEADSGEGGTAVAGNNNTVVGGDLNGNG